MLFTGNTETQPYSAYYVDLDMSSKHLTSTLDKHTLLVLPLLRCRSSSQRRCILVYVLDYYWDPIEQPELEENPCRAATAASCLLLAVWCLLAELLCVRRGLVGQGVELRRSSQTCVGGGPCG